MTRVVNASEVELEQGRRPMTLYGANLIAALVGFSTGLFELNLVGNLAIQEFLNAKAEWTLRTVLSGFSLILPLMVGFIVAEACFLARNSRRFYAKERLAYVCVQTLLFAGSPVFCAMLWARRLAFDDVPGIGVVSFGVFVFLFALNFFGGHLLFRKCVGHLSKYTTALKYLAYCSGVVIFSWLFVVKPGRPLVENGHFAGISFLKQATVMPRNKLSDVAAYFELDNSALGYIYYPWLQGLADKFSKKLNFRKLDVESRVRSIDGARVLSLNFQKQEPCVAVSDFDLAFGVGEERLDIDALQPRTTEYFSWTHQPSANFLVPRDSFDSHVALFKKITPKLRAGTNQYGTHWTLYTEQNVRGCVLQAVLALQ